MKHARVINIELKSSQDVKIFYNKWEKWLPENMPKAISRTLVRTSPMADFDSRGEMYGAIEELGKNIKSVFPEFLVFAAMETSENS